MGLLDNMRYRIAAALTPQQMSKQLSRPNIKSEENQLVYKDDKLSCDDYDKMLKDPQIKAGFELIRNFLLSRKLMITPADTDDEEGAMIAKEAEDMLSYDMDYPLRKVRNDMYLAMVYGFSVGEIVWGTDDDEEQIHIRKIRPIPIDTLPDPFVYDEYGDLEMIIQEDPEGGDEIEIPPEKCLIYTYDEQFGDKRGHSILDACYDNWFMKQKLLQWWNVYLQKHEGPTLAAFIENPSFKEEYQDMLEDVREGRANITAGVNDRVEVLESAHRGEGFKDAIDYHDTMIFRKMNIGTLLLGEQGGSGAYAQSKTQYDTLAVFLDGIHEDIAIELQSKLNEWVDMHYNVEEYPRLRFESFEEKDIMELINGLKPLIDAMAIDPTDQWFKQVIADAVQKYTDVDMNEFLEEEEEPEEQQMVSQSEQVVPTPTEKEAGIPEEQANMIEDIGKAFTMPGQTTPGPKQ